MINERKIYAIEFTVIILLWTLVLVSPLLFMDKTNQNWKAAQVMWAECSVIGFAFLVNRFLLMPRFFFTRRYSLYALGITVLLVVLGIFILYFDGVNLILNLFSKESFDLIPIPNGDKLPPQGMPPQGSPPQGMPLLQGMPPTKIPHLVSIIPPMVTVLLFTVVAIALDVGIRIAFTWIITEQKQASINRERIATQLQNLQSQVSPHFFMNTLNNIHALVDLDSQRAKQTIIELSSLMSYLLYESSNKETVALKREIEFISNYINLMRLRYSKRVQIVFTCDEDIPSIDVPPLLFLNFIENAFKYGVDYDKESIIRISFHFSDTHIEMSTLNSNHSSGVKRERKGLGISNSRKRLDLLYGDDYSLSISEKDMIYYVNLKIPIQ